MNLRTVRDVIGDPRQWSNCISDETEAMPEINGAEILDVFANGRELAIYLRDGEGIETLSVFEIREPDVRDRLIKSLQPGRKIQEVLEMPI